MNSDTTRCAITGATGFIGRALVPHLRSLGHDISIWPRSGSFDLGTAACADTRAAWIAQLHDVDVVIHLAGIAHQPRHSQADEVYFRINRDGTLRLAEAAHAAGVKRFLFLSSAKVFGEGGDPVYDAASLPAPQDAYALSKLQAEQLLLDRFAQTMEIVILRPPLVYGRDAKANFGALLRLAQFPLPLPFAAIDNKRALIGLDNLIDLIAFCLTAPQAAGKSWPCADSRMYSLADIITAIRQAQHKKPRLFPLPPALFTALRAGLGAARAARLFGDFKMDCTDTDSQLKWSPPFSMEQILRGNCRDSRA